MRRLISLICLVVGIMAISSTAFALDGNNWIDKFADGITGKGDHNFFSGKLNYKIITPICEIKVGGYTFIEMGQTRGKEREWIVGPEVEVTF